MKYGELIAFEPIDSVKVLRDANDLASARRDVETLVVSPRLAQQLSDVILPNLNLDEPRDPKGILVVANYGTGKTHLMSVISSIAEHGELLDSLRAEGVEAAAAPVAGRYQVIRAEIGATQMSLRDIITTELSEGLKRIGVDFEFPDLSRVTGTKRHLEEMMQAFEAVHGDQGVLFVLDEMLDYLASRRDNELRVDLAVLREIGEICKTTRFRFIGGVQEAIFDNPRFASAADAVSRVKERFTQMRISRDDIAFVVQERLLRKTPEQKAKIRQHIQQFTPAYEGMAENLEAFVALYPVHPSYLKTFELVTLVEKRKVLTTLSDEMRKVLDAEVPADSPGLICYDTYRAQLDDEPSNRAVPEIAEVLDKAQVLRARVEKALPTKEYISTALRIIDALAVHRLTTDDINAPIGPSVAELRDDLTLMPPGLPEIDAFFLATTVESIVEDIIKAVSGQFITVNEQNGQVYLDVRKDIDYDQKIEDRAESLSKDKLDEAYFRALETVLEQRDNPYVAGYRIWSYELAWTSKHVTRPGYLFMGAPNERSTAQPPRDFYVYFLQPYDPPKFSDEEKPDEVFFRLATPDDEFTSALRRYAGAIALEGESNGQHRTVYGEKHRKYLQDMVAWLRKHMGDAITVTHQGKTKPLASWLTTAQGPRSTVKEQIDTIAAVVLVPHFESRYPGYPDFGVQVTRSNLGETIKQALLQISTGRINALGSKVLSALNLLDIHGNMVDDGPFAAHIISQVEAAGGRAVNRDELFSERDPDVFSWGSWHLELGWFVVAAAALVQMGRIEIGFSDGQLDALGLDKLTRLSLDDLEAVTHIAPPKELPINLLKDVVKLLDVAPGAVGVNGASEALVQMVATNCATYADRIVRARSTVGDGITMWGAQIVESQIERTAKLKAFEETVNNLKARNTVGKLNKLNLTKEQIAAAAEGKKTLQWVEATTDSERHIADVVAYLREAVDVFGATDPVSIDALALRNEMLETLRSEKNADAAKVASLKAAGEDLRRRFTDAAVEAHQRDRLDGAGDDRKRRLREGTAFADLGALSSIPLLPGGKYETLQQKLADLGTCKTFDPAQLSRSVTCPECSYRPRPATGPTAMAVLSSLEEQVTSLRAEWERAILDSVSVPEMAEQVALLKDDNRKAVQAFVNNGSLPEPVTDQFVRAVGQVLNRFEVKRVSSNEIWKALFPEAAPVTLDELKARFTGLIEGLTQGGADERIRIVPTEEVAP